MGPRMIRVIGVALILSLGISLVAFPFGIGGGIGAYTIDLTAGLSKVGSAVAAAGTALGLSQSQINNVVGQVTGAIPPLAIVPVPLVRGTVEIGVPLVVIDSVRISGGIMTDSIVRGIASAAGTPIPRPLIDEAFTTDAGAGTLTADLSFSTYALTIAVGKRLDLFLTAIDFSVGATWIAGEVTPQVTLQAPNVTGAQVSAAIAALHPDGISWSGIGLAAGIRLEIGPPFLRLRAGGGLFVPVYTSSGWWGIKISGLTVSTGIAVRF